MTKQVNSYSKQINYIKHSYIYTVNVTWIKASTKCINVIGVDLNELLITVNFEENKNQQQQKKKFHRKCWRMWFCAANIFRSSKLKPPNILFTVHFIHCLDSHWKHIDKYLISLFIPKLICSIKLNLVFIIVYFPYNNDNSNIYHTE